MRHSIRTHHEEINCSITKEGIDFAIHRALLFQNKVNAYPEIIYTSPYKRTIETSNAMNAIFDAEIKINYDIVETFSQYYGNHENFHKIDEELKSNIRMHNIHMPESYHDMVSRCKRFVKHLETEIFEFAIVVSHWGLVNMLAQVLGYKENFPGNYCDAMLFENDGSGWKYIQIL